MLFLFHGLEKSRPVPICKVSLPQAKTAGTGCRTLSKKRCTPHSAQSRKRAFGFAKAHEHSSFPNLSYKKSPWGAAAIPAKEAELGASFGRGRMIRDRNIKKPPGGRGKAKLFLAENKHDKQRFICVLALGFPGADKLFSDGCIFLIPI